jgi:hypothetical protein
MRHLESKHASEPAFDRDWANSVEESLDACLALPTEELKHEVLCQLLEQLICRDFYYAREVSGVSLTQRAHRFMEPGADVGIDYYPRCDFLLRPKEHIVKMGFPDMFICVDVKAYKRRGRGVFKKGQFNDAVKQCIDYNDSVFFLSRKHADPEGNVLVPGTAIRPAYSFVFYNGRHFGRKGKWPYDVSCQCHVGRLHVVRNSRARGVGWEFDLMQYNTFAKGWLEDGIFHLRTYGGNAKNRKVASGTRPLIPPMENLLKYVIPRNERWRGLPSGRLRK